jgi:hypothetical protein
VSKRKSNLQKQKARKQGFKLERHPLSGADPDLLKSAFNSIGARSVDDFPILIGRLEAALTQFYPLHVLAILTAWGTTAMVGHDGIKAESIVVGILQHHIELLQALILRLRPTEWGKGQPMPQDLQPIIEDLRSLADAFHQRRFLLSAEEKSPQERVVLSFQEQMRLQTQFVRNWGYESDVRRISRELYGALDVQFHQAHGFSASELLSVAEVLESTLGERIDARFQLLRRILRQKSVRQMVRLYHRDYPDAVGDPGEFIEKVGAKSPITEIRQILLSHADLSLIDYMAVRPAAIAKLVAIPVERVVLILNALSLEPANLSGRDPEHLFLNNPVWRRPGIKIGSGFFFALPQAIFSFIFLIMRDLCAKEPLKAALSNRRAAYLEAQLVSAVRTALPAAIIAETVKWSWEDVQYETDLLALTDTTLLIGEAKSAALTDQALRGAPDRVRRHVRELIVSPAEQSARLATILRAAQKGDAKACAAVAHFPFRPDDIHEIARLSVTLEDVSALAALEDDLKAAGWAPRDLDLAPTLNLADLWCVADILNSPLQFLHYFVERTRLQKALALHGDELDLLALYLQTGFNFAGFEEKVDGIAISGMSAPIDHYYMSRDAGVRVRKPTAELSPYFRAVIEHLEARAVKGWTTLGLAVLRLGSPEEQRRIDRGLETLRRSVPKEFRDPKHRSAIVVTPPRPDQLVGIIHVHTRRSSQDHRDAIAQLATEVMEAQGRDRCIGFVRIVEDWTVAPYQLAGIFTLDAAPETS